MQRRILLIAVMVMGYASSPFAAGWSLVTPDEYRQEQKSGAAAAPKASTRALTQAPAGAPIIELEQPDGTKPVKSPVDIKIVFRALDGASIDPASVRITYGFLKIDITKRVLDHATLTADGLSATGAALPSGQHNVTMQVKDSKGRVTAKTFSVTVL